MTAMCAAANPAQGEEKKRPNSLNGTIPARKFLPQQPLSALSPFRVYPLRAQALLNW
jgi:hypothetical protein